MRRVLLTILALGLVAATVSLPAEAKRPRWRAEPAWGPVDSPLRPGASLEGGCTFDWIFYTPGTRKTKPIAYVGTAGHCTEELGERVGLDTFGEIGTVVFDGDLGESGIDMSLIRIDPAVVSRTNPAMLGWNGPKGAITTVMLSVGDRVDVYGYGLGVGLTETTRPRWGVLTDWDEREYVADMPAVNGDSGAPLLHHDTGYALGVISRYGVDVVPPSTDHGPMMPWIFEELRKAGFKTIKLATIE